MGELIKMADIKIICGVCGLDLSANAKFEGDEIEVEPCAACIAEARADARGEEHEPYYFDPEMR